MGSVPRNPPPAAFLVLLVPFGVSSGYVSVTLAFMLAKAGMPTAAVAAIVAFSVWPQTWKVIWAPLVDTTLGAKAWYLIGAVLTAASIGAVGAVAPTLNNASILTILVIVSSLASTLVSMSSEILMSYGIEDARKGVVSGWSQAGNLGGAGIGGGLGLFIAQHVDSIWIAGTVVGLLCLLCCLALLLVDEPVRSTRQRRYIDGLIEVFKDLWSVARSRPGLLALLLMLLPIGSGGAQGVWSAIAGEWQAGADTVALVNGVLGGIASLVGAVAAGFICDRMERRLAYCVFGLALAAVAIVMALLPRTPAVFVITTLAYALVLGACYAAYSAVVLEAIGRGAAATKFNLLASVSNIPVAYMTDTDGVTHDRFGTNNMLYGEAGAAIVAVVIFMLAERLSRRKPGRTEAGGSPS